MTCSSWTRLAGGGLAALITGSLLLGSCALPLNGNGDLQELLSDLPPDEEATAAPAGPKATAKAPIPSPASKTPAARPVPEPSIVSEAGSPGAGPTSTTSTTAPAPPAPMAAAPAQTAESNFGAEFEDPTAPDEPAVQAEAAPPPQAPAAPVTAQASPPPPAEPTPAPTPPAPPSPEPGRERAGGADEPGRPADPPTAPGPAPETAQPAAPPEAAPPPPAPSPTPAAAAPAKPTPRARSRAPGRPPGAVAKAVAPAPPFGHPLNNSKPAPPPGLAKKISLDLRQMDVLAVMKFLADQGDLNIVTSKNVGGRVTLALKDVTILDGLDIIALTHELAYVVQSRVIHVMTEADYLRLFGASFADQRRVHSLSLRSADATNVAAVLGNMKSAVGRVVADVQTRTIVLIDVPEKLEQMVAAVESMDRAAQMHTEVFELRYGKIDGVRAEVEKLLTPKVGAIRADKRTNTLVVTDLLPQMQDVQRVIDAFDRPTREVIIEAKIVEVRLSDRLQIGVDWEALLKGLNDMNITQVFPVAPPITTGGKLIVGTLSKQHRFNVVLQFLQTVGKTNVLSTPQIATVENEEAKILVGTREAFITSLVTQTANAATTAEQVSFVDVGLQLKVLPTINDAGMVTMKIKPEVSSVNRELVTGTGNRIPIVETSSAETTVMVKDGVTIVIAGLMKDERISEVRKMPILGDLPLLGFVFRNTDDRVVKSELIFFLTPTIISGGEAVAGSRSPLARDADQPKE
jgi:type II secretory pathway component GspD/PulD (secretin)